MASSGEYPLQGDFGWTSGVLQRLLALYPEAGGRTPGDVALSVLLVLTMAAIWTIFSG